MWYYHFQNQTFGPVGNEEIKALAAENKVLPSTLVWTQGMSDWQPAMRTSLASLFPQQIVPSVGNTQAALYVYKPVETQIKELNDLFLWYWICLACSIFTFGLSAIASMVLFYIILYRSWQQIQDGYARTTPGKAVGFLFIPFFSLYWIFEAYTGFVRDSNAYIQRHALPVKRQDEGLATAVCVLTLLCLIPYLNIMTGLALFVLQIILIKNFKDTAVDLINARQ